MHCCDEEFVFGSSVRGGKLLILKNHLEFGPTLGVIYVCLIYILSCDMQMSGHCSIHVCFALGNYFKNLKV